MRTNPFTRIAVIAALAFLPSRTVRAQQAMGSAIGSGTVESGTLSFDGHATLGDFTGTTTTVTGAFTGGADLTAVRGWVEAPVITLKTGNGKRDTDLNKSMESEKYPTIRFDLEGVTVRAARGDTTDVTLSGQFTIHGVTRSVDLPGRVIMTGGQIRVLAETPMNLKDYQIGGLSKMLGVLKMSEHIEVHIGAVFTVRPADS